MSRIKPKLALFILFFVSILFFSNDFGLIDIEKTAIITAIAIDKADDGDYLVTCQIAVPESSNAVTENQKAQISGKGSTVGSAIKSTGSTSGWFPQTIFCNLIILGGDLATDNVITVLDYFSKTMRVQDSAQVILADKKAGELLTATTPLDNISSFAIQKILLKNPGFDRDVAPVDVKTFCVGYYSLTKSSFMPQVKVTPSETQQGGSSGGSGGSSGGSGGESSSQSGQDTKTQGKNLFDATTTALFLEGKKVGELNKELTHTLNMLTSKINGSAFSVDDVDGNNYLLSVLEDNSKLRLKVTDDKINLYIDVKLYCKISDQNTTKSDSTYEKNQPLPHDVKTKTENMIKDNINNLFSVMKQTKCDFLYIKEKLYRYHHKRYSSYKDNYLDKLNLHVNVDVHSQK